MPTKERYINLFTDYGFKKIFGEEPNKNLLLDFVFDEDKDQPHQINSQFAKPYPLRFQKKLNILRMI